MSIKKAPRKRSLFLPNINTTEEDVSIIDKSGTTLSYAKMLIISEAGNLIKGFEVTPTGPIHVQALKFFSFV